MALMLQVCFLEYTFLILGLALFLLGSSPCQTSISWISNILRLPMQLKIHFHIFIQWPLRNPMQSLSHTLSGLGDSLKLWKKSLEPIYRSIIPTWITLPSSTSCLGCNFNPLYYIWCSFCLLPFRSRKYFRHFPVSSLKLMWVGLARSHPSLYSRSTLTTPCDDNLLNSCSLFQHQPCYSISWLMFISL